MTCGFELWDDRLEVRHGLQQYGGGRGVFSKAKIRVGSVVMSEEAAIDTPESIEDDDMNMHAAVARTILESPNRDQLLKSVASLCPVHLTDLPAQTLTLCRQAHHSTVARLVEVEEKQEPSKRLPQDALLRLLMAMQMNAFCSGICFKMALVNHSCLPNCVKFKPAGGRRSDLIAVRDIAPGDEIFQAYIQPFGQSELRRRTAFEEQHLWPLPPSPFPSEMDELASGQPKKHDPTYPHAMAEVDQLEDNLEELSSTWQTRSITTADALKQIRELLATGTELLAPQHLVQARIRYVYIDVLQAAAKHNEASSQDIVELIKAARELLAIQEAALGSEHCDVAETLDSLQQAMEFLMSTDKDALRNAYPEEWTTFAKASKAQYSFQKRCKAIQKLYE